LLIGPWLHGGNKNYPKVGDLTFPEAARFDLDAHLIRWFDHHLKGQATGVERDPAVRYYVMGAVGEPGAPGHLYREAADWPVPAQPTAYFLRSEGQLSLEAPTEATASTSFRADPLKPTTIPGRGFPGARDAQPFESQAEVRTFTTEPLTKPIEWTDANSPRTPPVSPTAEGSVQHLRRQPT
jgi:putative CocE/NonD family hydrolase